MFVKLVKRLMPYKKLFIISLISTLILYAADVVNPILQRILIDDLIVPNNKDWSLFLLSAPNALRIFCEVYLLRSEA